MCENISMRKCHIGLDVQKLSSANIHKFTVVQEKKKEKKVQILETFMLCERQSDIRLFSIM